jgi:dipeptidyl aminopeptidase/acylaminoacyl peptidase
MAKAGFFVVAALVIGIVFVPLQEIKLGLYNLEKEAIEALPHPLSIEALRRKEFSGSDIVIEETLEPGINYNRYLASYQSEGLKIYALLTVPKGEKPENGWPVIVFNHGYIPPDQYKTTEKYLAYTDGFAKSGYLVMKPDYRGHGDSEGEARGAYRSNDYTIDVLNAVASIKRYEDADPEKIGMWGHSMGGQITLRSMVVSKDIKAGVIWAGVVAPYSDLVNGWFKNKPQAVYAEDSVSWEEIKENEKENNAFWDSVSPNSFLNDLSGPLQLHHGTGDDTVPFQFSEKLASELKDKGKEYELFFYEGDNHNLSTGFNKAMQRSVQFFDKYLKSPSTRYAT